jgi:hypothetical protein
MSGPDQMLVLALCMSKPDLQQQVFAAQGSPKDSTDVCYNSAHAFDIVFSSCQANICGLVILRQLGTLRRLSIGVIHDKLLDSRSSGSHVWIRGLHTQCKVTFVH